MRTIRNCRGYGSTYMAPCKANHPAENSKVMLGISVDGIELHFITGDKRTGEVRALLFEFFLLLQIVMQVLLDFRRKLRNLPGRKSRGGSTASLRRLSPSSIASLRWRRSGSFATPFRLEPSCSSQNLFFERSHLFFFFPPVLLHQFGDSRVRWRAEEENDFSRALF